MPVHNRAVWLLLAVGSWHFRCQASSAVDSEQEARFNDAAAPQVVSVDARGASGMASSAPLMRSSSKALDAARLMLEDAKRTAEQSKSGADGCSQTASDLSAELAALAELNTKEKAKVERMEKMLQNVEFGLVGDEVSLGTYARQYNEPRCLCLTGEDDMNNPLLMDKSCMTLNETEKSLQSSCRSGFPFFRMRSNALNADMCFKFCVGMGLDAFAVVRRKECRCGITAENTGAWGGSAVIQGLIAPDIDSAPAYTRGCHILAGRYLGLTNGQTPSAVLSATDAEEKYIKSLMLQRDISKEDDAEIEGHRMPPLGTGESTHDLHVSAGLGFMLVQSAEDARRYINEPCTPGLKDCATKALFPKHGDLVEISIYLQTHALEWHDGRISKALPETTLASFREAMRRVEGLSNCIKFNEVDEPGEGWENNLWEWGVIVGKMEGQEDTCYLASSNAEGRQSFINLGWCDSEATLGNQIHEIFHALGMSHEMKRPDAWETYTDVNGDPHGPYLNWIGDGAYSDNYQLLPDPEAYLGSTATGWAEYDFDSIMHYQADGTLWETIPSDNNARTGQRSHPSVGDIAQMCDFYHCSFTTTTSTTTTHNNPVMGFFHALYHSAAARVHTQASYFVAVLTIVMAYSSGQSK